MLEFWLTGGGVSFRFPVNPPSVSFSKGFKHEEIAVIGLGGITFPQSPELARYSFGAFFPAEYNPTYCEYADLLPPFDCVSTIETMMNSGQPVRLTISGSPINTLVTIRSFNYEPWRQYDSDIPFTIELVEYRTPTVARVVVESADSTTTESTPTKGKVNVGKGKTLTVRKTASASAKSAGKLSNGAAVSISAVVAGWFKISTSKLSGYAPKSAITVTESTTRQATIAKVAEARPVALRAKGVSENA